MEMLPLTVTTRVANGKGGARKKRAAGLIPITLYGEEQAPVTIEVGIKAFEQVTRGKLGENALLDVTVADRAELNCPAMIRGVQHHPVSDKVLSADFLRIRLDKAIMAVVPIKLVGQCKGLLGGGITDQSIHKVEIKALPLDVPNHVEHDITELSIGDTLHVSDLVPPTGVEVLTAPERAIISIKAPRVSKRPVVADAKAAKKGAAPAKK
jgi:large subunit ribosomal protein L25